MKVSWPVSGEEGQGDSQSDLPASPVFSDSFSLKDLICQVTIFGGSVAEGPSSLVGALLSYSFTHSSLHPDFTYLVY